VTGFARIGKRLQTVERDNFVRVWFICPGGPAYVKNTPFCS
jgi:hypothetical protein